MGFEDHFSRVAAGYRRFRPSYPTALFDHLARIAPRRERAWDCGTGSGQAATALAARFDQVIATDPSLAQLAGAPAELWARVACTAERCCLADRSVDLVTVAQALHWFDTPAFYDEVRRVARPDGLLAVWSYDVCRLDGAADAVLERLYRDTLAGWWSPERRHVEAGYRTLPFPFDELVGHPPLALERRLTRSELVGYVETWSAVSAARRGGADPIPTFRDELTGAWPDADAPRTARWPLALRVGRVGPAG